MSRKYKRYTKEFKLEAVRLAEEAAKPVTDVARELGIRVNQIYKWKQKLEAKSGDAFPGKGRQSGVQAEVMKLRKEVERLRIWQMLLNLTVHYFQYASV